MKLQRDLLVLDYESFEPDIERAQLVKIAAAVLDRDNQLIKNFKEWFVRHSWLASTTQDHARLVGVDPSVISSSGKPLDVARGIANEFSGNLLCAFSSMQKYVGFRYFFRRQSLPFPFEGAVFDLHTLYQIFALRNGWNKSPSLPGLAEFFGKRLKNPQDPSERVRLHAEVLVKVLNSF